MYILLPIQIMNDRTYQRDKICSKIFFATNEKNLPSFCLSYCSYRIALKTRYLGSMQYGG